MLLTVTTTAPEATDLGYLLHKHPDRLYERELGFGVARVFFPEAEPGRCTAALAIEVDPVGLVRGAGSDGSVSYVNDRPYVSGSLLSVAMSRSLGSALAGRSSERPERVEEAMPIEATLSAVHCPGGEPSIRRAFEPLGYEVTCNWQPADPRFPDWGDPMVATVTIRGHVSVRDVLRHVYILAPVLDGAKHYFIGEFEVDKLIRHGTGWLAEHPFRDWIVRRYLRFKAALARKAISLLVADDAEADDAAEAAEESLEEKVRLNDQRHASVLAALRDPSAAIRSVADLGCGEGKFLGELARDRRFERVLGLDVSTVVLDRAERRLDRLHLTEARAKAIRLIQGSLLYRDERLTGFDAAVLIEVIEHVEPSRLPTLEHVVFDDAKPKRVIVTTPNADYNRVWDSLPAGQFRHRDHRFEWTRAEFEAWAARTAARFGYVVKFQGIGPLDPLLGSPTQMGIFDRGVGA